MLIHSLLLIACLAFADFAESHSADVIAMRQQIDHLGQHPQDNFVFIACACSKMRC